MDMRDLAMYLERSIKMSKEQEEESSSYAQQSWCAGQALAYENVLSLVKIALVENELNEDEADHE